MKKYEAGLHYSLIVLILTLLFSLNYVANSFSGTITAALCGTSNLNSSAMEGTTKQGAELSQQIAEEGITLLKNDNDALPLISDVSGEITLNVFGASSSDKNFVYQGYGSGGGSRVESTRISLYNALRGNGISINEELAAKYNAMRSTRSYKQTGNDTNIYEASKSFYSTELMASARDFSNNALIVISRVLGEAYDAPESQTVIHGDSGSSDTYYNRNYLQLCEEEEYMISKVCDTFENVIVLLNSTNVMECGFLQNSKIDAALTIYAPGHAGSLAVGSVLTGSVTPSGRTVDTWAYDFTTAATYANAGQHGTKGFTNQSSAGYVDYAEGIYQGYYWYETADAEGYWADVDNEYGKGYNGVVQYPFGYGLSYTDFEWNVKSVSIPEGSALTEDSEITVTVEVKNVGKYSGMDVVQLYATPQYYVGGIEKPEVKLVAFEKTGLLAPGQNGEVQLKTRLYDMASYDVYDANKNGFMGYEAEKGSYTLSLRTNSHEVASLNGSSAEFKYKVERENGILFDKDPDTGADVVNRFTTYTNTQSNASSKYEESSLSLDSYAYSIDGSDAGCDITYMTRANFKGTFPVARDARQMSDDLRNKSYNINKPRENPDDVKPEPSDTNWKLPDLIDASYDDPRWMEMVRQVPVGDLTKMFLGAAWMTIELPTIEKPICSQADGPSGFNMGISGGDAGYATNYPCETLLASTWNWRLAYQFGMSIGEEADAGEIQGWYGPACTLHRSPLSGRNFEYYSEDPVLSGNMVAYTIKGAMGKGLYTFIKHFVAADTESMRRGKYTWLTEQALREVYLKPFEYAVKLGETTGIMTAYNRIGSVRCSGSYQLNTAVLRGEWGFEGAVISDYFDDGDNMMDPNEFLRAGNDLRLNPETSFKSLDTSSATAVKGIYNAAKNTLYAYAHARYVGATSQGLDLSTAIGTKSAPFAWWVIILVAIDVASVGGCGIWAYSVLKKSSNFTLEALFKRKKALAGDVDGVGNGTGQSTVIEIEKTGDFLPAEGYGASEPFADEPQPTTKEVPATGQPIGKDKQTDELELKIDSLMRKVDKLEKQLDVITEVLTREDKTSEKR